MEVLQAVDQVRLKLKNQVLDGKSIGFVPTMGALHEGHLSLINNARRENDLVIVSIFINPAQFGPNEDFGRYPRTFDADKALLEKAGVDFLFFPEVKELYPFEKRELSFQFKTIDKILCGKSRPNHFNGVALVVAKLLNIVKPTRAYFGMKDFQQCKVLERMVVELNIDVELCFGEIIREKDGLAMSSRNRCFSEKERNQALSIYKSLLEAKQLAQTERDPEKIRLSVIKNLKDSPLIKLDYFEIRDSSDLSEIIEVSQEKNPVALIAAFVGKTRLIDNIFLFS